MRALRSTSPTASSRENTSPKERDSRAKKKVTKRTHSQVALQAISRAPGRIAENLGRTGHLARRVSDDSGELVQGGGVGEGVAVGDGLVVDHFLDG